MRYQTLFACDVCCGTVVLTLLVELVPQPQMLAMCLAQRVHSQCLRGRRAAHTLPKSATRLCQGALALSLSRQRRRPTSSACLQRYVHM